MKQKLSLVLFLFLDFTLRLCHDRLARLLNTRSIHVIRGLARLEPEAIVVGIPQRSKEHEEEHWSSEKVKNAVEDHLAVDREHVRALG